MASTTTTTAGEESIVLTIRLIRSFVYRNVKNLVVHVDPHMTVAQLKDYVRDKIQTTPELVPFRKHVFDTLAIFYLPHGHKPNTLTLCLETGEDDTLRDEQVLAEAGIQSESELSFYNAAEFAAFKVNPEIKW